MVSTWYGDIDNQIVEQFSHIRLLVCDIDGVFSDGRIYLGNDGEELKAFHTRDGFGIKALINSGLDVAVITGRQSRIVENRMRALGVQHIFQGQQDKSVALQDLQARLQLDASQIASLGDDVPDLPLLQLAGLGIAVRDAHPSVQQAAGYITALPGGFGAVREVSDLILLAQGHLNQYLGSSE
jgi:3-deoxy-D-manno-octulosonate 8-phosphate phosphatase (KDO 8-P phosphatase)